MEANRNDAWSAEEDAAVIALRADQFAWDVIAERVGRSVHACGARYRQLLPVDSRPKFSRAKRWSSEDEKILMGLLAQNKTNKQISEAMGRSRKEVYSKVEYITRMGKKKVHTVLTPRVSVPVERLEDRERRMAAERDLTAEFFGDPRPGQSALDKRAFA